MGFLNKKVRTKEFKEDIYEIDKIEYSEKVKNLYNMAIFIDTTIFIFSLYYLKDLIQLYNDNIYLYVVITLFILTILNQILIFITNENYLSFLTTFSNNCCKKQKYLLYYNILNKTRYIFFIPAIISSVFINIF